MSYTYPLPPDAALIAEAIAELAAYDDEEHRAALQLVRQVLTLDAGDGGAANV